MNARINSFAATLAAGVALTGIGGATAAHAQTGFFHRHRVASGVVAGIAAHHAAKRGAAGRAASGRRGNFAERHPILTGAAAGMATHHFLKHH